MSTVKRRYDSTRRRAQAAATREDVLDAAGELFASCGYAATSIDAIAARAGVSRETIFKTFGTKRDLLQRWAERQVAGCDEPVPIASQRWVDQLREAPDGGRRAAIVARAASEIYDRSIDALVALRAAADADTDIAALWQLACRQRRADVTTVTAVLVPPGGTDQHERPDPHERPGTDDVVDVVYTLTSPEVYELLVRQCGWAPERFRGWLADALERIVLEPSTPRDA